MKLNTFFSKLTPRENKFYPIFNEMSDNILVCSDFLVKMMQTPEKEERKNVYKQIKALETKGDGIVAHLFDELNNTFITPFDREDINALGEALDNVLDSINSVAKRVVIYQPNILPEQSAELALLLKKSCQLIQRATDELDIMKSNPKKVKHICKELHVVENQADDLYEHFIISLFETEKNSIELIKMKEIMQELEHATDNADSVGKIIKTIIVKYA